MTSLLPQNLIPGKPAWRFRWRCEIVALTGVLALLASNTSASIECPELNLDIGIEEAASSRRAERLSYTPHHLPIAVAPSDGQVWQIDGIGDEMSGSSSAGQGGLGGLGFGSIPAALPPNPLVLLRLSLPDWLPEVPPLSHRLFRPPAAC